MEILANIVRLSGWNEGDKESIGTLTVGNRTYHTVELPWLDNKKKISCIPVGTYKVIKRHTEKYGHHFWLQDVVNRDYILIHPANYVRQLLGCIAPGLTVTDIDGDGLLDVTSSKAAMADLNKLLPDTFYIKIENKI